MTLVAILQRLEVLELTVKCIKSNDNIASCVSIGHADPQVLRDRHAAITNLISSTIEPVIESRFTVLSYDMVKRLVRFIHHYNGSSNNRAIEGLHQKV